MELEKLGFNNWFKEKLSKDVKHSLNFARISAVDKESFHVISDKGEMQAEVAGKFRFDAESSLDFPTVGDWAFVEYFNDNTLAIINKIFPRKTLLKRKAAGKKIDYQLIGANIDTACIVQSLDQDFNIRRLERYLSSIYEASIEPVIFLSKSDLMNSEEIENKKSEILRLYPDIKIIVFSSQTKQGLGEVENIFIAGKTYCLIGSSGVGKTTLINKLIGEDMFVTKEVREDDHKGKHATTRRQLIVLKNGALLIDNPGMRELGNISVEKGISIVFSDIEEIAKNCKFKDCTHTNEPKCAIREAIENGQLDKGHYKNYVKMQKEAAYHSRSYYEKRQKDKAFGKMVKSVMKEKKKNKSI